MKKSTSFIFFILAVTTTVFAQISTEAARESLRGERIRVPNYSEITPIDWTFSDGELIELDIISQKKIGQQTIATVQIKTTDASHIVRFTKTVNGIEYFPKPMVEGRLRLTFDGQTLKSVDNLSVKYRFVQPETVDNTAIGHKFKSCSRHTNFTDSNVSFEG